LNAATLQHHLERRHSYHPRPPACLATRPHHIVLVVIAHELVVTSLAATLAINLSPRRSSPPRSLLGQCHQLPLFVFMLAGPFWGPVRWWVRSTAYMARGTWSIASRRHKASAGHRHFAVSRPPRPWSSHLRPPRPQLTLLVFLLAGPSEGRCVGGVRPTATMARGTWSITGRRRVASSWSLRSWSPRPWTTPCSLACGPF